MTKNPILKHNHSTFYISVERKLALLSLCPHEGRASQVRRCYKKKGREVCLPLSQGNLLIEPAPRPRMQWACSASFPGLPSSPAWACPFLLFQQTYNRGRGTAMLAAISTEKVGDSRTEPRTEASDMTVITCTGQRK